MAATLPIQYSQQRMNTVNPVYRDTNVNSGKEALAEGVVQVGKGLYDLGTRIQMQKDNADLSEVKRRIGEEGYKARNSMTGEDADNDIINNFESNSNKIIGEYSPNVQRLAQNYLNDVVPDWKQGMYEKGLGIKKANAKDKVTLEFNNLLANGSMDEALRIIGNAKAFSPEDREYYDNLEKNAPIDSKILQANKLLLKGKPQEAQELLDELDKMDLSVKQLDDIQSLKKTREKNQQEKTMAFYSEAIPAIADSKLDANTIEMSGMKVEDIKKWKYYVRQSFEDAPMETDSDAYDSMIDIITQKSQGALSDKDAYDKLLELRYGYSEEDEYGTPPGEIKDASITDDDFKWALSKIQKTYPMQIIPTLKDVMKNNDNITNRALLNWVDSQSKPPTPDEIQKFNDGLQVPIKKKKAKGFISNFINNFPSVLWLSDKYGPFDSRKSNKEVLPSKRYDIGDTRTINGITYTFDGEFWSD